MRDFYIINFETLFEVAFDDILLQRFLVAIFWDAFKGRF